MPSSPAPACRRTADIHPPLPPLPPPPSTLQAAPRYLTCVQHHAKHVSHHSEHQVLLLYHGPVHGPQCLAPLRAHGVVGEWVGGRKQRGASQPASQPALGSGAGLGTQAAWCCGCSSPGGDPATPAAPRCLLAGPSRAQERAPCTHAPRRKRRPPGTWSLCRSSEGPAARPMPLPDDPRPVMGRPRSQKGDQGFEPGRGLHGGLPRFPAATPDASPRTSPCSTPRHAAARDRRTSFNFSRV